MSVSDYDRSGRDRDQHNVRGSHTVYEPPQCLYLHLDHVLRHDPERGRHPVWYISGAGPGCTVERRANIETQSNTGCPEGDMPEVSNMILLYLIELVETHQPYAGVYRALWEDSHG